MTQETMTVHQALAELKVIDNRIYKKISNLQPCVANKATNIKINGVDIKEYQNKQAEEYQSITDLINRRFAIKKAVVLSNASTFVTIGGEKFTVAEAIEMKNHGIELKEQLCMQISSEYQKAITRCNTANAGLEEKAEKFVIDSINGDKTNISNEVLKERQANYIRDNTWAIVEAIDCNAAAKKLEEEINQFTVNVDSALSISNAITQINIEY